MKNNARWKEQFHSLKKAQKIELVLAAVLTLAIIIGVPVYAWFVQEDRVEAFTKIKAPITLDIRAGKKKDIENFVLDGIDLKGIMENNEPERFVFCVKTGKPDVEYDIQLAHTTNIPFTYTLYRAAEVTDGGSYHVDFTPIDYPDEHTYYKIDGAALNLEILNGDQATASHYGRELAKNYDGYYSITYDSQATDGIPEIYAVPLYSQATVTAIDADYDFFILELGWTASSKTDFDQWNIADNNKESDVIYISASIHTQ